jgi:hypothetical protein
MATKEFKWGQGVQRVWRSRSSPIIWQAKCRRFEEALIATLPPNTPALCYGATTGSTPFPFNLHQGDTGHTMIEGPTRLSPIRKALRVNTEFKPTTASPPSGRRENDPDHGCPTR